MYHFTVKVTKPVDKRGTISSATHADTGPEALKEIAKRLKNTFLRDATEFEIILKKN